MKKLLKYIFLTIGFVSAGTMLIAQGLPIKATRTISFTTDEGTSMDIDVSPDGTTLAFCMLGDLYTLPVTGGKATQITRGIAINTCPRWSPDGKMIAYWSDTSGAVHCNVMTIDHKNHIVLGGADEEESDPRDADIIWSPDSRSIATGEKLFDLSGKERRLDSNEYKPIGFRDNGNATYSLEIKDDTGGYRLQKIYRYEGRSKQKTLLSMLQHTVYPGVLSPDARYYCFYSDSGGRQCLILADLLTKETRLLVAAMHVQDPYYLKKGRLTHFGFSPDSKTIYIGYGGKIHRVEVESGADTVIPFSADVKADLGPLNYYTYKIADGASDAKYIRSAHRSPDGKHLVFSALDKVYLMDLPAGKPKILVHQAGNQSQPAYSADGKWVAYINWQDSIGGSVWRIPASGGKLVALTQVYGEYSCPTWSPDGQTVAVVRLEPKFQGDRLVQYDPGKVELISVPNHTVRVFADSVAALNSLSFSAYDKHFFYVPHLTNGMGFKEAQLVSASLDSNRKTRVVALGKNMPYYVQRSVSPDARYLVYSATEDLFLTTLPKGGQPITLLDKNNRIPAIHFAAGVDPHWEKGGKVLTWSYGNRFYKINPDKVIAAARNIKNHQKAAANRFYDFDFTTVAVKPDEIITIHLPLANRYAKGIIALTNARVITMQGEKIIEKGTIVIRDRRILAAGPVSAVKIPIGAKTVDLSGATIMPGLVDLHFHTFTTSPTIPEQYWSLQAALAYGTTTIRDPSQHLFSYGYAEALDAGLMTGPRMYTVGEPAIMQFGLLNIDSLEEARRLVNKRKEMGSIVVKNYLTGDQRLHLQWLQLACREAGLNLTNEGNSDPLGDIAIMKDGNPGIEHNPEWKDVYKDVLTFFAKSGTWLTPTLSMRASAPEADAIPYSNYQYWRHPDKKLKRFSFSDPNQLVSFNSQVPIEAITDSVPVSEVNKASLFYTTSIDARIRHLGGRVTMGSHGNDGGIGPHNELWALQMGGLTNMEALQAGTIMAAEALGLQKDLGSIEPGKIADLVILNKNPLDDIHNSREIRYVMKDGILYDGETLDEIWPEKKKCRLWKVPKDPAIMKN